MAALGLLDPMAKPKSETTVRMDVETASVVRKAAALREMTIAEYLREVLLPVALRDLKREAKKFNDPEK